MSQRIFQWLTRVAAISALLPSLGVADPVGRLFFTPEQRAAFDLHRNTGVSPSIPVAGASASPLQGGEITLNGIVKRSDGRSTLWVNQVAQYENDAGLGGKTPRRHANLPNIQVFVPALGKAVNLKVGQTLDTESREIRESYQPLPFKGNEGAQPTAQIPSPSA